MKLQFSTFLLLFLFSSCDESADAGSDDPSNLTLDITISEDGSGLVNIEAMADNTTDYHFYSGVSGEVDPIENTTGVFEYTYLSSGIYTVEVLAFGSSGRFIKKTEQITVETENNVQPGDGYITPPSYDGMTLVWSDEFDGNSLNLADWTFEIGNGNGGWGNDELEYYLEANTTVTEGILTIEAKNESFNGYDYTSSRIITKGKQQFRYGRVDIRAVLPYGQGLWPALWMLGSNIDAVGWPACGEVDIMEMVGGSSTDNEVHGTIHWDNNGSYASYGNGTSLASGIFADEFHVFSIIWDENKITWYLDDVQFNVVDITPGSLSEFHQDYFFIFNVAVGGRWPGSPNSFTVFPQKMMVDYIRVFQDN
ncbi:MAG: glycoside hydrolase family 16 protein [Reichenbachiella sp.]